MTIIFEVYIIGGPIIDPPILIPIGGPPILGGGIPKQINNNDVKYINY